MLKRGKGVSVLLTVVMLSLLLTPMGPKAKSDEKTITLLACGDYQAANGNEDSSNIVTNILTQMKYAGYESADGLLCIGDYDYEYEETTAGIRSLKQTVQENYTMMNEDKMVFAQGNHDVTGAEGLSPSGANDTADYGVYVIHEDDYPWCGGAEETVLSTASALENYLKAKDDEGYNKPIFVVSHLPLHYTMRTYKDGDGKYGEYIFNVLNKYGAKGQNIIFLYGHNHNSWGYDDYLGGSAVYLAQGDTMYVSKVGDAASVPNAHELAFTYVNAGYVGYNYSGNAGSDKELTMTVFSVTGNAVTVERYSASGVHNMKSQGVWSSVVGETKATYGAEDTYLQKCYESPQLIGDTVADGNVEVLSVNLTELTVYENTRMKNEEIHTAYMAYDITAVGYELGNSATVKVTLSSDVGFDEGKTVYIKEQSTGDIFGTTIRNNTVTFRTNALGSFELIQFLPVSSVQTEQKIYRPLSGYTTNGNNYLIVSSKTAGDAFMMKDNGDGTVSAVDVEIISDATGTYIASVENAFVWKWLKTSSLGGGTGIGDFQNQGTNRYLYGMNGSAPTTIANGDSDCTYWKVSSGGYLYTLTNTSDQSRHCIQSNNGFQMVSNTALSSSHYTYLFEESSTFVEDAVCIDSAEGRVTQGTEPSAKTGSKILFTYQDGTVEVVEITVDMLRDVEGHAIDTTNLGKQDGLQVYYNEILIYDNYMLHVCHANGYNYLDVSTYRFGDVYTYPEETGCVFAGWYQDAEFTTPLSDEETSGWAYAKFVDETVLSVKGQLTVATDLRSESTDLRIITSVDSLEYRNVGFRIQVGEGKISDRTSKIVYSTIVGYKDGEGTLYKPTVFSSVSKYFSSYRITDIPDEYFRTDLHITPIWTTVDGTVVTGVSRTFTINEYADSASDVFAFEQVAKAGDCIVFDAEVYPAQDVTVTVYGCNEDGEVLNILTTCDYVSLQGKKTIAVPVLEDIAGFQVKVTYNDKSLDAKESQASVTAVQVLDSNVSVQDNGDIVFYNPTGGQVVSYLVEKTVKKGDVITFDVDINEDIAAAVYVLGDLSNGWNQWFGKEYSKWPQTGISVTVPENAASFTLYIQYRYATTAEYQECITTITNLSVPEHIQDDTGLADGVNPGGKDGEDFPFNS